MSLTNIFVNVNAPTVTQGLVRGLTDNTSVTLPELVLGDTKQFNLYLVDGAGNYASFSGSAAYTPFLAFGDCGAPTGGTFTLTSPNGLQTTSALAWNSTPAQVQTALQALSSIGSGNVSVSGVAGEYYIITFQGTLANQPVNPLTGNSGGLTPASALDISTLVAGTVSPAVSCVQIVVPTLNPLVLVNNWTPITNGWSGTLSGNTLGLIEAFQAGGGSLEALFQVTVEDPSSNMATYVQVNANALCSIVNLHSFAAAVNPSFVTAAQLAAAVLGLNNFTRQNLAATTPGNTNVIPQTTSRNHTAWLNLSGATAGTYTVSIETVNSPQFGDQVMLTIANAPTSLTINIYNATTGGTLLKTITTDASGRPYTMRLGYNSSAWELDQDDQPFMSSSQNLAGLSSTLTSKKNLKTIFNTITPLSANYSVVAGDDGTIFLCSCASGSIMMTLPSPTGLAGMTVAFQKADGTTNPLFIAPGVGTLEVDITGETVLFECDGANWQMILDAAPSTGGGTPFVNPMTNEGDMIYQASGVPAALVIGPAGAVMVVGGGGDPEWGQLSNIAGYNLGFPAGSGFVGEVLDDVTPSGSPVALSNATPANIASLTLSAGDWEVSWACYLQPTATTNVTSLQAGLNETSATLPALTGTNPAPYASHIQAASVPGSGTIPFTLSSGSVQFNMNSANPVYLVAQAAFTASTMGAYGWIKARRVR